MNTKPRTQTSYPLVVEWFKRSADGAKAQSRRESAMLWTDGLEHLEHMREQRDELLAALQAILDPATNEDSQWYSQARQQARAAVKKATS